jgi:hypothetical protein
MRRTLKHQGIYRPSVADFEIKSLPALQRHARAGANRRDGPAEDRAWIHCDAPNLHQKAPGRVIRLGATHSTRSRPHVPAPCLGIQRITHSCMPLPPQRWWWCGGETFSTCDERYARPRTPNKGRHEQTPTLTPRGRSCKYAEIKGRDGLPIVV